MKEKNKYDIWLENNVIHYFFFFILFSISPVHMRVNIKKLTFWNFFWCNSRDFFQAGYGLGRSTRQARTAMFLFWAVAAKLDAAADSEIFMGISLPTLMQPFTGAHCQGLYLKGGITEVLVESSRNKMKVGVFFGWLVGFFVCLFF